MKVYHVSDLHFCERFLALVRAALAAAIEDARVWVPDLFVFSGDSFDNAIQLHHPAVQALLRLVHEAASIAPVFILQGTFSHDRPGCLEPFKYLSARYPVHVCEAAERIALRNDGSIRFERLVDDQICSGDTLYICGLPSVNRAEIQAKEADTSTGDYLERQFTAWAAPNRAARERGIPSILVSHGTVNGCMTESKQAMVSPDHEFGAAALFSAVTDAVLLGHIHAYQSWTYTPQRVYGAYECEGEFVPRIAYPGSIARLINGHEGAVGGLRWDVRPGGSQFTLFETPGPKLVDIEFAGPPDMEKLAAQLQGLRGTKVRVRYSVDEEHRKSVDRKGLEQMLAAAGLYEFKVEGTINPVQRTRAAGISREASVRKRLEHWCELTSTAPGPLVERLHVLEQTL